jgi:hypothetical protein
LEELVDREVVEDFVEELAILDLVLVRGLVGHEVVEGFVEELAILDFLVLVRELMKMLVENS